MTKKWLDVRIVRMLFLRVLNCLRHIFNLNYKNHVCSDVIIMGCARVLGDHYFEAQAGFASTEGKGLLILCAEADTNPSCTYLFNFYLYLLPLSVSSYSLSFVKSCDEPIAKMIH